MLAGLVKRLVYQKTLLLKVVWFVVCFHKFTFDIENRSFGRFSLGIYYCTLL